MIVSKVTHVTLSDVVRVRRGQQLSLGVVPGERACQKQLAVVAPLPRLQEKVAVPAESEA